MASLAVVLFFCWKNGALSSRRDIFEISRTAYLLRFTNAAAVWSTWRRTLYSPQKEPASIYVITSYILFSTSWRSHRAEDRISLSIHSGTLGAYALRGDRDPIAAREIERKLEFYYSPCESRNCPMPYRLSDRFTSFENRHSVDSLDRRRYSR